MPGKNVNRICGVNKISTHTHTHTHTHLSNQ